jgi:hypothetical protein
METTSWKQRHIALSLVVLVGVAGVAAGAITSASGRARDDGTPHAQARWLAVLGERMTALDAAIDRGDVTHATHAWRAAYPLALLSRRWEPMIDLGDAAVRIDALAGRPAGYPTGFRAEARQAYLRALFQAREERATDGMQRVARAFAALGDREMASRASAVAAAR